MRILCFRPCGTTIGSRTHIVKTCKSIRDDQDVLVEETRKKDQCGIGEFGRLFVECIDEMMLKLGDRLWLQTDKREGDRIRKKSLRRACKKPDERPTFVGVAINSKMGANFHMVCVANGSNDQYLKQTTSPYFRLKVPNMFVYRAQNKKIFGR